MSPQGITPFAAFNTLINVLMGTGPILLPPTVAGAGYGFGVICLIVMCVFSMAACDFIIEALAIANAKLAIENHEQDNIQTPINDARASVEPSEANQSIDHSVSDIDSSSVLVKKENRIYFILKEQFEYGSMSKMFFGKYGEIFSVIIVVTYLFGALISKGIIVGTSLQYYYEYSRVVFQDIYFLNNYQFWVIIFFIISGVLSFKDIASIAIVQTIVAVVRYITIVSMLIGSVIIQVKYEVFEPMIVIIHLKQWFNFDKFPQLLSTAILAYLMHHSSPGMLKPIEPQSKIRMIMSFAFIFGASVFLIVPLTAMWAFPNLNKYCYYSSVFNQDPVQWAYYIISFYMFLNISALPVLTITIRKNLMKLTVPHRMPKNNFVITPYTAGFTLMIIVPCTGLALLLQDEIELVVAFTGGVCGVIILLVIPPLLVWKGRKVCPISNKQNPFRSMFRNQMWIFVLLALGCLFVPYNIYIQIHKLLTPHVACHKEFDPEISGY